MLNPAVGEEQFVHQKDKKVRKTKWYHRIKTLGPDGKTIYGKRGGFNTKEEAEASYLKYEEAFKKDCRKYQMSTKVNTEISLKD